MVKYPKKVNRRSISHARGRVVWTCGLVNFDRQVAAIIYTDKLKYNNNYCEIEKFYCACAVYSVRCTPRSATSRKTAVITDMLHLVV